MKTVNENDKICVNCKYCEAMDTCDVLFCSRTKEHAPVKENDTCKHCDVAYYQITEKGMLYLKIVEYDDDIDKFEAFFNSFQNTMRVHGFYSKNKREQFFNRIKRLFRKNNITPYDIFLDYVDKFYGDFIKYDDARIIWNEFVEFLKNKN